MGNLFGGVVNYDGRPTQSQLDRTQVLAGQLAAAQSSFESLTTGRELAQLNSQLEGKSLEPIAVISREEWDLEQEKSGAASTTVKAKVLSQELAHRPWWPLGGF